MKFDMKLLTGVLIGMVLGLHYGGLLTAYLPLLMVVALIFTIKLFAR